MAGINLSNIEKAKKVVVKDPAFTSILNKEIKLFGGGISDKRKEGFYLELSILLSAGVDIKSAMDLIIEDQLKGKEKTIFAEVQSKVVAGSSLSIALKETGKFSDYEVFSLQIGEETGKVSKILHELSLFYKNKIKQKRQAVSALSYPIVVLCTLLGVVTFMLNVIVPMFAEVFTRFGGELPYLTKLVIQASDLIGTLFYPMLIFGVATTVFFVSQKKEKWFRKTFSGIFLRIPVLGELIRKIYLARFSHTMNLLISSKIPLLRALGLVRQMINFYPIEESLAQIEKDILQGEALYRSMSKFDIFDRRLVSLIKVGEEVNRLDEFFEKIYNQYTEDVDHQSKVLSSMIEPIMIVFLGIVVGVILIAMYLPMFKLSSVF